MKLISRLLSDQAIRIQKGKATSLKGKHSTRFLSEITATCRLNSIESGEIWIDTKGTLSFSGDIPHEKHQQFRNTIRNAGS